MKKIPPYGHWLFKNQKDRHFAIIFIGHAGLNQANYFHPDLSYSMALPPFTSPFKYKWPVSNCDVRIVDTGQSRLEFIENFAALLSASGATQITYITSREIISFK
jgi:hypothetical protein